MDFLITFFRDILDGPLYIVIVIFNSILICSCIGYLGESYLNKKKEKAKFNASYVKINVPIVQNISQNVDASVANNSNNVVNANSSTVQNAVSVSNVSSVTSTVPVNNQVVQTGAINRANTVNQTSTLSTQIKK